ncbi:uncharacterized protein SPPG_07856 [Spizellomyces punctatus DAOM BR117]|uniref:Uncharacterized protein n=1 Tax=Spizellomyces punctatus (strain DAOM BR117) TaxID=645134 RepID=A0A0L0H7I0_SPIPD|nr:uncharacterized protein SPPG_07856 [Spizellomyces punctatus DAOM BR117]KNC96643.1 hypothetical protein SPPG_07856 [Spizellomyces punctatus DAOM BR117]|eukprot:XP_016604683.1 hypothetical protein SPPG_07856 [Spizellomyces punctatus DAOM BR117]
MGSLVSSITSPAIDKAKDALMMQQVAAIKQNKEQRDRQLAMNIAATRDRVYWMSGTAVTIIGLAGLQKAMGRKPALAILPVTAFTALVAYQVDLAWGTKINRLSREVQAIRAEPNWWFNEPLDLPPVMRGPYRKFMDEQNAKLKAMGEPPEKDWAR